MATKKQIAAAAAAQKKVNQELTKTKALASKTTDEVKRLTSSKITTPDNTAFGLSPGQTSALTPTEQKMFGGYFDYTTKTGVEIPAQQSDVKQTGIPKDDTTKDDRDAFAQLQAIFESYGLGDLSATITKLMTEGKSASEALMLLKYDKNYNQAYTTRFKGNADRIAKGLNALSEAEYITNEDAYAETFRAYGLNNMLSLDRKVNQAKFAQYIANDVSSTEFNDRISTVVDNVVNADPAVMNEFKKYYGGLTTSDVVSYFLAPAENLPILKQKAEAAAIGAESFRQGLGSNTEARSMELSKLGITKEKARVGYSQIGEVLPESQKLSNIYKETNINYDKTAGEDEYLKGLASAKRKREQLKELETGTFSGSSGRGKNALQGRPGSF
jgi:hypothetical protein